MVTFTNAEKAAEAKREVGLRNEALAAKERLL